MKINIIDTGTLKLDGGAMFGVVPKRLWQKLNPPDENNLCTWAMRCLLIQTGGRNILVDTGIGSKQGDKFRTYFEPRNQEQLFTSLAKYGLKSSDITDVFLTHLHFDHVGGAVKRLDGQLVPTFENATYWSNRTHFEWAVKPNAREAASFLPDNFLPLSDAGVLKFVDENEGLEIWPDVNIHFVDGHTKSMMYLKIKLGAQVIVYCADLIPSSHHIGLPYIMSYDVKPLTTLKEKKALLNAADVDNYILVFEHDPLIEAATVQRLENGRFKISKKGTLNDLISHSEIANSY